MTSYYHSVADGDVPTETELASYKQDSIFAAKQLKAYRTRKLNASIWSLASRILNRMTLCNSSVSALVAAGTLIAAHSFA